jgi:chromate reductase
MRLLGLVGSLRRASHNRALLRAIAAELPDGVMLEEYPRLGDLPLFNSELDLPEPVADLKAAIAAADGLVFVTPEYNYSIPGVLKNAIDWASRPPSTSPLRGKPCGLASTSVGISGGMRAQYHLRQILLYTNTLAMVQPEVIIPHSKERFSDELTITDEPTRALLARFGAELVAWVRKLAP